jgi:hypothetical protein
MKHRPLNEIAYDIVCNWKNVNYAAKPYLDAMLTLRSIHDKYYYDDASTIVMYFLGNAQGWRGEVAKKIKEELKQICKMV